MLDKTSPTVLADVLTPDARRLTPDTAIDRAYSAMVALSDWMRGRERIVDDYAANRAHEFIDRANKALAGLEDERDSRVRPLNEQVKAINDSYRQPRTMLEKVRDVLKGRLTAFAKREEAERLRKAEEARKAAEAAAQAALEAEQKLTEALIDEAQHGVVDTDFGMLEEQASRASDATAKACRDVARTVRHTKVRIGGGFSRVMTLKSKEILAVTDWKAAIEEMGLTDGIAEAILTAARNYRKAFGDLPAGITATHERSL